MGLLATDLRSDSLPARASLWRRGLAREPSVKKLPAEKLPGREFARAGGSWPVVHRPMDHLAFGPFGISGSLLSFRGTPARAPRLKSLLKIGAGRGAALLFVQGFSKAYPKRNSGSVEGIGLASFPLGMGGPEGRKDPAGQRASLISMYWKRFWPCMADLRCSGDVYCTTAGATTLVDFPSEAQSCRGNHELPPVQTGPHRGAPFSPEQTKPLGVLSQLGLGANRKAQASVFAPPFFVATVGLAGLLGGLPGSVLLSEV